MTRHVVESKRLLFVVLFLQLVLYILMFLNVSPCMQVLGFLYLMIIPGVIVTAFFGFLGRELKTALLTVGISIMFLIIFGLSVNQLLPLTGIHQPLSSTFYLMIILNIILLLATLFLIFSRRKNDGEHVNSIISIEKKNYPSIVLLLILPVISIIGAYWVNIFNSNTVMLLLIIAISAVFVAGVLSNKILPKKLYPLCIFTIALSLLFHSSLISNYIVNFGSDVSAEYYGFKLTQLRGYWDPSRGQRFNPMLSINILPTLLSNLLNIDGLWIFKIVYPLIFALVPVILYEIWREYYGEKHAFISSFFFMSFSVFYTEMLGLNRQIVAELFFALLLLVTLKGRELKPFAKNIYFLMFSFGLIVSHYGVAEIFLFFLLCALIISVFTKRSSGITPSMVVLFFVIMFSWYIYISHSAVFNAILDYGNYVWEQLDEFFNPTSREPEVLRGLGLEPPPTIWNMISRFFAYITELLIVIGFVALLVARKSNKIRNRNIGISSRSNLNFLFTALAMVILACCIILPGFSATLNMTRFYHIVLFFLAPLCVLGMEFIISLMSRKRNEMLTGFLILVVLVPYFLFQTGFVYEIVKSDSWSVSLSKYRMNPVKLYAHFGYTDTNTFCGALWLSSNIDLRNVHIYGDYVSTLNLFTYALIHTSAIERLTNITSLREKGLIYLSSLNVIYDKIVGDYGLWNASDISAFDYMNCIYTSGSSEIYQTMRNIP